MSDHFRPTAEIAPDVLVPSDPGLAMALAQRLTRKPLMANHHHGLWGYSGRTHAGRELTVQAGGIGGPSTAVVIGELATHGALRIVRIGRCDAIEEALEPGAALVVTEALGGDGASTALGSPRPGPDAALLRRLADAAGPGQVAEAVVVSSDVPLEIADPERREAWRQRGAVAADLETAATLAAAARLDLPACSLLAVARGACGERDEEAVGRTLHELGELATRVFAAFAPVAAQAPGPAASLP